MDFSDAQLNNIPVNIGYLKSIGLDFGWGPTAMMEWLLEHVHVFAGTPWWASIMMTTVIVRLALFRFYVASADATARSSALAEVFNPLNAKMIRCKKTGDTQGAQQARLEIKQAAKAAGLKPYMVFVPIVLQGVLGYGSFRLLRNMANLPVPGLDTAGFLWLQDLTISDPYYILPTCMALFMYAVAKVSSTQASQSSHLP